MNFLHPALVDLGAESQADAQVSTEALALQAGRLQAQLAASEDDQQRAELELQLAEIQLGLGRGKEAWERAFAAFRHHAANEQWTPAVLACDVLFRADQPGSLAALAHGVWLSVTFPLDPALTIAQLQHIVDETPDHSDGAAVAAATAAYIAGLRGNADGDLARHDDITLAVGRMLSEVARRHGNIHDQAGCEAWLKSMELDQPGKFLPRLRNILDALAAGDWWIDRDALQARLPQ